MSTEVTGIEGDLPMGKVVVVASRYNPGICDSLVAAALETLASAGYNTSVTPVVRVPGAWELPTIVRQVIDQHDVVAAVALGCVIKGETSHDEHINRAVSLSLMQMGVDSGKPIAFASRRASAMFRAMPDGGWRRPSSSISC